MASSVKVLLKTNKTLKNGEHPIYLRIIMHRKTSFLSIGASCSKELWDEANNQPKKKHPLHRHICLLIDHKKTEAQKKIIEIESKSISTTSDDIKESLRLKEPKNSKVLSFIDQKIADLLKANRIGTAKIFKSTRNSLYRFNKEKDFSFSQVDLVFIENYEQSLLERGVKPNSIFVYMRTFKTLINHAKKSDFVDENYNPFKDFSFIKYRKIKTKKRKISKDSILKIGNFETEEGKWVFHAQKIFMFSYYNFGINFIDISFLKWDNIRDEKLHYTRRKTADEFSIKLNEPSLKILAHYREHPHPNADNYIFPILSSIHKLDSSKDNRIRKVLKIVNKNLRTIAAACDIDEHITTYVARHSFAHTLKVNKVPTSVISEMMGHETEKVTQVYLDSFESETIDDAAKHLI